MKSHYDDADRIAALDAALADMTQQRDAALVGAVKVKPLVWEQYTTWPDAYDADSTVGRYSIGRYDKGVFSCHVEPQMRDIGLRFLTVQDAMAAAQADYEARIRAALQPDPDARQADLAKAWTMGRDAAAGEAHGFWIDSDDRTVELSDYIRALTPPADLAAKIGGE